jgi:putative transposase
VIKGAAPNRDKTIIEAFNGRFRAECSNANWLLTLADASEKMEAWLRYYNEDRPHDAIGYKALIELANPGSRTGQLPR